jgi:hypothetical protein
MQNFGNTHLTKLSMGSVCLLTLLSALRYKPNFMPVHPLYVRELIPYSNQTTLKIIIFFKGGSTKTIWMAVAGSQVSIETRQRAIASLKFNKSTFCPQGVFPSHLALKITAITSLNFNRPMFVTEKLCLFSLEGMNQIYKEYLNSLAVHTVRTD